MNETAWAVVAVCLAVVGLPTAGVVGYVLGRDRAERRAWLRRLSR